jgi:hypothetical protein
MIDRLFVIVDDEITFGGFDHGGQSGRRRRDNNRGRRGDVRHVGNSWTISVGSKTGDFQKRLPARLTTRKNVDQSPQSVQFWGAYLGRIEFDVYSHFLRSDGLTTGGLNCNDGAVKLKRKRRNDPIDAAPNRDYRTMTKGVLLASFSIARVEDGSLTIIIDGVTHAFHEEHAGLSVQPNPLDFAQLLVIEAAGALAARERKLSGPLLAAVN